MRFHIPCLYPRACIPCLYPVSVSRVYILFYITFHIHLIPAFASLAEYG
jgi:hypothetical protein